MADGKKISELQPIDYTIASGKKMDIAVANEVGNFKVPLNQIDAMVDRKIKASQSQEAIKAELSSKANAIVERSNSGPFDFRHYPAGYMAEESYARLGYSSRDDAVGNFHVIDGTGMLWLVSSLLPANPDNVFLMKCSRQDYKVVEAYQNIELRWSDVTQPGPYRFLVRGPIHIYTYARSSVSDRQLSDLKAEIYNDSDSLLAVYLRAEGKEHRIAEINPYESATIYPSGEIAVHTGQVFATLRWAYPTPTEFIQPEHDFVEMTMVGLRGTYRVDIGARTKPLILKLTNGDNREKTASFCIANFLEPELVKGIGSIYLGPDASVVLKFAVDRRMTPRGVEQFWTIHEMNTLNSFHKINSEIADINLKVEALRGAIIYLGHVPYRTEQIAENAELLTAWCREKEYYPLVRGYCVVDANANDWWWNEAEEKWINIGYFDVATATNATKGVVRGTDDDLGISIYEEGKMRVNGLQGKLDTKLNASDAQDFAKLRVFASTDEAAAISFSQANPSFTVLIQGA